MLNIRGNYGSDERLNSLVSQPHIKPEIAKALARQGVYHFAHQEREQLVFGYRCCFCDVKDQLFLDQENKFKHQENCSAKRAIQADCRVNPIGINKISNSVSAQASKIEINNEINIPVNTSKQSISENTCKLDNSNAGQQNFTGKQPILAKGTEEFTDNKPKTGGTDTAASSKTKKKKKKNRKKTKNEEVVTPCPTMTQGASGGQSQTMKKNSISLATKFRMSEISKTDILSPSSITVGKDCEALLAFRAPQRKGNKIYNGYIDLDINGKVEKDSHYLPVMGSYAVKVELRKHDHSIIDILRMTLVIDKEGADVSKTITDDVLSGYKKLTKPCIQITYETMKKADKLGYLYTTVEFTSTDNSV